MPRAHSSLRIVLKSTTCALALSVALAAAARAAETIDEAFAEGKFSLDAQMRYENVDHELFANNASALTFRARFGYETGELSGFKLFVEGDFTRDLEPDKFNSTVNGKVQYPVVADPDSSRLNRLTLSYSGLADTTIAFGRQRIIQDGARFIGNVGWRQNEQTYDALRLTNTSIEGLTLDYTYLWQVNRIFGSKSAVGRFDADTHLIHASYKLGSVGTVTGYGYFIDLDDSPGNSNSTFGARFTGATAASDNLSITYAAEYAVQKDYANNPDDFSLNYLMLEGGVKTGAIAAHLGYELLESNGLRGFVTPLATLHKFQGFADSFLATPAAGITDLQAYGEYTFKDVGSLGAIKLQAWFHDFGADVGNEDLGEEIDLQVSMKPWNRVSFAIKYANHFGADLRPEVRKFWISLGFVY